MVTLGKKDLLRWAAETTGIRPCSKYRDLGDGAVLLALALHVFPTSFPSGFGSAISYQGKDAAERNWDVLQNIMEQRQLPMHLFDRRAFSAGQARHCFNTLVLFYFLDRLKHNSHFCVDFANPVDPRVADFLQSPQSLTSIGKFSIPPSSSSPSPLVGASLCGGSAATVGIEQAGEDALVAVGSSPVGLVASGRPPLRMTSPQLADGGVSQSQLSRMHMLNTQLREELDNVRATSHLLLAQQRVIVATEIAAMTEQLEAQLLLLRQQRDHEIRRCLREVREEYDTLLNEIPSTTRSDASSFRVLSCSSGSNTSNTDGLGGLQRLFEGEFRNMQRELDMADSTIQQLRTAVNKQQERLEALEDRIRCICSSTPPVNNEECTGFINNILEPLFGVAPRAVVETVGLRLKYVFSRMDALRCEVQRLRGRDGSESEAIPVSSIGQGVGGANNASLRQSVGAEKPPLVDAGNFCYQTAGGGGGKADEVPPSISGVGISAGTRDGNFLACEGLRSKPRTLSMERTPLDTTTSPTIAFVAASGSTAVASDFGADEGDIFVVGGDAQPHKAKPTVPSSNSSVSLLSLEELERRKHEIMSKYGFSQ